MKLVVLGPLSLPALCWCIVATAGAPAPVTSITLERDCSGCATGTRLELHRDGRGTLATTGLQRGTQDKQVFARGDTGPAALKSIERAIETAKAQIIFSAERR